jgi:uncharacterized spore protein YtfJ
MEAPEILQNVQTLTQQIASKTIYGEPVLAGSTTIVPVASVAFGMGGGFGKNKTEAGHGGGGGGASAAGLSAT